MDSHGNVEAPSAAPPAVLLVDDDAAMRLAIRSILAPLGHAVIEADSGRAALRVVLGQDFALILMDVRMPTLDGYETARLIRQRSQTRLTPIIFITASVKEHPMATATAYASGAVDFIFTPIIPDVRRAKVSTFVDLFVQSQELQILNAALRDSEARAQAGVPGDAVIVRSTIDLAHNLGMTVVAEGVEDEMTTTLLILFGGESATSVALSTVADAIVALRYLELEGTHDRTIQEYEITDNGIRVLGPFHGVAGILAGRASFLGGTHPTEPAGRGEGEPGGV